MYLSEAFLRIFISSDKGNTGIKRPPLHAASLVSTIQLGQENPEKGRDHFAEILMDLSSAPHSTFPVSFWINLNQYEKHLGMGGTRQMLTKRRAREIPLQWS